LLSCNEPIGREGEARDVTTEPGAPSPTPPEGDSDTILPFGVGERLDDIAQERFNRTDWIELAAAVLLALATIVAAWSAYQSTRWGGEQAKASRAALEARADASQLTTIFTAEIQVDVQLWTLWLQQAADENEIGQAFVEERFRDEFKPAFEAWLAQAGDGEPPPGTPFDQPQYQPASRDEAGQRLADSEASADRASDANQTGDNFVLTAVIMASVLFFAGVGTKLKGRAVRLLMLFLAALLFLGGVAFMLSLPQNVGI
jgi:hypothetical protein